MNTHLALQMTILILVRYETLGIKKKFQAVPVVDLLLLLQSVQHLYQSEQIRPDRFVSRQLHVELDRKSTRLNSSHVSISYAVFCLKKKKKQNITILYSLLTCDCRSTYRHFI